MLYKQVLCEYVFSFLRCIPRNGIAGPNANSVFNFTRNYQTVFHSGCAILHSHQECTRVLIAPYLYQHLLFPPLFFLIIVLLMGEKSCLLVVLICISLITKDVEHLFRCLLADLYLLCRNVYSNPLSIF